MFSKACEYSMRAAIYVAMQSLHGKRVSLKEIAFEIGTPVAFTAKILQKMASKGVLNSTMGSTGGFEMCEVMMRDTKLSKIVFIVDGDQIYNGCALGLPFCNAAKPCPLHEQFLQIRDDLKLMLQTTSIYELAMGLKDGFTFLKR